MTDLNLDRDLRAFIDAANRELLGEHSPQRLHAKIDALTATVKNVSDNLAAHVQECHQKRRDDELTARSTNARLVGLEARRTPSVPPMRPELDSSHDHAEDAARAASLVLADKAKQTRGPNVDATPEEVAALVQPAIEQALREQKAVADQKRLEELEAADAAAKAEAKRIKDEADSAARTLKAQADEDKRKRRTQLYAVLVGALSAAVLGIVTTATTYASKLAETAAQQKAIGHAEGVAEVRSLVSTSQTR